MVGGGGKKLVRDPQRKPFVFACCVPTNVSGRMMMNYNKSCRGSFYMWTKDARQDTRSGQGSYKK